MTIWRRFWNWYEGNYILNVSIALGLFFLQILHLIWLFGDVVWFRLSGEALFVLSGWHQWLIVLVDYTEIPAIISVSLVYLHAWRQGARLNAAAMLFFLNIQWLHLFWITDEFVIDMLTGGPGHMRGTVLPHWLAWVAIVIDYLEVPVITDTALKLIRAIRHMRTAEFLKHAMRQ